MDRKGLVMFVGLSLLAGWAVVPASFGQHPEPAATPLEETPEEARSFELSLNPLPGDFDAMLERRRVRILVPHSRSLYYTDRGVERGLTAQIVRDFERFLNTKYKKELGNRPLTVFVVPTTRDVLLSKVADGYGDIAAGNLTVTDERLKLVDFVSPEGMPDVAELLLTGPSSPAIATLDDLAGKKVHVRKSSSYHDSLTALSDRFVKEGKQPITITLVPDALEDEDMMEMLNAGLFQAIVVDDWKAKLWVQILPKIKVHSDIPVHTGGKLGWAIRKESPLLTAEINEFYRKTLGKQGSIERRVAQYASKIKQIQDPTKSAEYKKFEATLKLFESYGDKYDFDPLMLAAQGFQESGLNQEARSHVGAIGIMQIMPATGSELNVGDIAVLESNVHAGAKYMDQLMDRYFKDANLNQMNRTLFAFASYNCGPGNVSKMRKLTEKRGLDPNEWFNNVEVLTAEKIGTETTTYVRNIFKYYAAYKLAQENTEAQKKAREQATKDAG